MIARSSSVKSVTCSPSHWVRPVGAHSCWLPSMARSRVPASTRRSESATAINRRALSVRRGVSCAARSRRARERAGVHAAGGPSASAGAPSARAGTPRAKAVVKVLRRMVAPICSRAVVRRDPHGPGDRTRRPLQSGPEQWRTAQTNVEDRGVPSSTAASTMVTVASRMISMVRPTGPHSGTSGSAAPLSGRGGGDLQQTLAFEDRAYAWPGSWTSAVRYRKRPRSPSSRE